MTPDVALRLQREGGNAVVKEAFALARRIAFAGGDVADFLDSIGADSMAFRLRLRVMVGVKQLEALEAQVNLALVLQEIERLKEDTRKANIAADHARGHPGFRGAERVMILSQIAAGNTSDVELTDAVFKMRHPERATSALDPANPADRSLIKEWVHIRRGLVVHVMHSEVAKLLLSAVPAER